MKSLFILALPRSLSDHTLRVARDALGLKEPSWVRNGEILNIDLYALSTWPDLPAWGRKFVRKDRDPERFAAATEFLQRVADPAGCIYKDVVNPFVVANWPGLNDFHVLKIQRDIADVCYAMLLQGWDHPRYAAPASRSLASRLVDTYGWNILVRRLLPARSYGRITARLCLDSMIHGLLLAEAALTDVPGETVRFDDLVAGEDALRQVLQRMYPDREVQPLHYIDAAFRTKRQRTDDRRGTKLYEAIRERVVALRRLLPLH